MKTTHTSSRKEEHVNLTIRENVTYKNKTSGFEKWEFQHNALPEINFSDIKTSTVFLGKQLSFPLIIASMTGGYAEARRINKQLAEVCATKGIALGVGSQRQALEDTTHHRTFSVVREVSRTIAVFGNIGATELLRPNAIESVQRLATLIEADGFAIHLNPLQEFLQPEGNTHFHGVLRNIESLVKTLSLPLIVKETGAGISADVAVRLLDVGVQYIDVAGAGGTSWAGVEILRTKFRTKQQRESLTSAFWDWGIPTADALQAIAALKSSRKTSFKLISSGGVTRGIDMAKSFALGADYVSAARPVLKALDAGGVKGTIRLIETWEHEFRGAMFLTGSQTLTHLQQQTLIQTR